MTSLSRLCLSLGVPLDSVIEVFDSDNEPTHSVIEVVDSDDKSLPKEKGQKRRHESGDEVDVVHGSRTTEEWYSFTQMDLGLRRAVFPVYVTQKNTYIEILWVGKSRRAMRTATRAEGWNRS
jgi:hypothetical protein